MNSHSIRLFSPAKLNIGLWITNKTTDGYHELQSLFWPIHFGDDIQLRKSRRNQVIFEWDDRSPRKSLLPSTRKNTVSKALNALDVRSSFEVLIKKRIPIGSGLGGSSSNAGTIARWLQRENFLETNPEKTLKKIGADIPFFLHQKPSWVEGIGEKITPLKISDSLYQNLQFLLIFPPKPLLTASVFAAYAKSSPTYGGIKFNQIEGKIEERTFSKFLKKVHNDLERPAALLYPLIEEIIGQLKLTPCLYAGMSGSGSTCFAIFKDKDSVREASKALARFCRKTLCRQQKAQSLKGEQHGNH